MPSVGSTLSRDSLPILNPLRPSICLPTLAFLQLTASSRCLKMLRNERKEKTMQWTSVAAGDGCLLPCPAVVRSSFPCFCQDGHLLVIPTLASCSAKVNKLRPLSCQVTRDLRLSYHELITRRASPDQSSFLGRSIKHVAACRMPFSAYRLAGPSFSRDTCKTCKGTFSDRQLGVLILPNPLLGHLYSPNLACSRLPASQSAWLSLCVPQAHQTIRTENRPLIQVSSCPESHPIPHFIAYGLS